MKNTRETRVILLSACLGAIWLLAGLLHGEELKVLRRAPDPFGYPRPAPAAEHVPTGTSFFIQLGFAPPSTSDDVLLDSIVVRLRAADSAEVELLGTGRRFAEGYQGSVAASREPASAIAINLEGGPPLRPGTTYTVAVEAKSRAGRELAGPAGTWQFTTAALEERQAARAELDLSQEPVTWRGAFFSGFCKPSFCTSASNRLPGYELMREIRRESPRAWSLQRDFSPTSTGHQPEFLNWSHPNVVRERETRRITAIEPQAEGALLRVEDFFGHQQYGIPADRPLVDDYRPGDEVLIADGVHDARARVVRVVDDGPAGRSLLVTAFESPADGWKIAYSRPLPTTEDPDAPGLFPAGGCYLRKFRPAGTAHYYWGRLDREWDIAVRQFGRRIVVNFTDAPGDLAVDGRQWTYPKDYVQFHQVVRDYTSHLIERYGDASLDFVWSIFNEPDLASAFWRSRDWIELQKFYDYATDAILRSFEDHGYDSRRVMIGGLEIGAIFGTHIENPILRTFLCHCSPTASCEGELPLNAAFADPRLEGRRSRRVEELCRAHGGHGSPCDFISVHAYNAAPLMAAKLQRAKELALEVDPEYYAELWVSSFESCPDWAPPPDSAAADCYLGSGYFSAWCADVARRRLAAAAVDPRYGFGETILTFWPWPNSNFRGHNNATQVIGVDQDGDGRKDRDETLALPILNFLGLLARMTDRYWVLPEQSVEGLTISGFASQVDDRWYLLLYAHDPLDVQARGRAEFQVQLRLKGLGWSRAVAREYRFDKDHNSYFRLGRELRDRPPDASRVKRPNAEQVARLLEGLNHAEPAEQLAAVRLAATFDELPETVVTAAFRLHAATTDEMLRAELEAAGQRIMTRQPGFTPADVARVKELSQLRATREATVAADAEGHVILSLDVAANGVNFVILEQH